MRCGNACSGPGKLVLERHAQRRGGDGNLDVVAGQGCGELPFWEGGESGNRVIWGPGPTRARDAKGEHARRHVDTS